MGKAKEESAIQEKSIKQEEFANSLRVATDRSTQIKLIANYVLETGGVNSAEKAIWGKEIFQKYQDLALVHQDFPQIPESSFLIYLSKIADSPENGISCMGKKQGYFLDPVIVEIKKLEEKEQISADTPEESVSIGRQYILEKDLYPILEKWLFERDNDRVSNISSIRAQGKWGNPDVVGLKIEDILGNTEVEITTIEAKITNQNWEQLIFEAIAHTIFANRSYFAFICPDILKNKLPQELSHYAEVFKIGIILIEVNGEDFLKIKQKQSFVFTEGNYKVVEFVPAPFNVPHVRFKKKFLHGMGIADRKELYLFGDGIQS